jgi:glutathione S-transferase
MIEIFYHPMSFPSLAPVFTASALDLEHKTTVVNLMTGENREANYLAINPTGKVPALKDGNFSMFESAAIMRYLARKAGSSLYPDDIQMLANIDQWIDFINHHIRRHIGTVQFNRIIAKMMGRDADESAVTEALGFLDSFLPHVDRALAGQDFLTGKNMSLADIALVAALEPVSMAQIDLSPYPALTTWLDTRRSEAFYTNVHTHFGAEMGMGG